MYIGSLLVVWMISMSSLHIPFSSSLLPTIEKGADFIDGLTI